MPPCPVPAPYRPAVNSSLPACMPNHSHRSLTLLPLDLHHLVIFAAGDDRKGGAHGLAKCFLSTDDSNHLAMYFHCPKVLHDQLPMMDWVNSMSANIGGSIKEQTDEFLKYEAPQVSSHSRFQIVQLLPLAWRQTFLSVQRVCAYHPWNLSATLFICPFFPHHSTSCFSSLCVTELREGALPA